MRDSVSVFAGEGSWECDASWSGDGLAVAVVSGHVELTVDGDQLSIIAGQAFVLPDAPRGAITFNGEGIIFANPELAALGILLQVPLTLDTLSIELVRSVFLDQECSLDHQRAALRLLCHQLLSAPPVDTEPVKNSEISGMLAWIDQHIDEPLTLDTLAEQFHCSRSTVLNRFRRQVGQSPMSLVAAKRVKLARSALEQTDRSVTDIARSVGYSDLPTFTRFIKAQTDHSPTEIRRKAQWVI